MLTLAHPRFSRGPFSPGSQQLSRRNVITNAHPRRVAKVAKQLEREIGNLLLFDRRLKEAVCPERKAGVDDVMSGMASVTEVVLSGDLQVRRNKANVRGKLGTHAHPRFLRPLIPEPFRLFLFSGGVHVFSVHIHLIYS